MPAPPPPSEPSHPSGPGEPGRAVVPERGSRLLAVVLDGGEVVYDPVLREAHLLNPTASALLSRCDGRTPVAELVADLAGGYGADPALVHADVVAALDDFAARRLVGPEPDPADVPPPPRLQPELVAPTGPIEHPATWAVVTPVVHALSSRLVVRSDEAVVGRWVDQVLAPLLADPSPDGVAAGAGTDPVHTFDVVVGGAGPIRLLLDGREVGATTTLDAAMSHLQWTINQLAVDEARSAVVLHAAAVRHGDRVAVLPAVSNSGKSTLAAGLVRSGLGYVTDEAVAIDLGSGAVVAYPKPISLDPGSWSLFPDAEPRVTGTTEPFFRNEWQVDPAALHPARRPGDPVEAVGSPTPRVAVVAFPSYVPGAPTSLEPLSPAEGLLLLLQNSFNLQTTRAAGLAALVEVARRAQVVRLTVGRLDDAVELVRTALERDRGSRDPVH